MEQKELREWESRCIQEEPAACSAGCPLGVSARAFVQAMARGDMPTARAVLEKTMPLVGITARICEAPCEGFCLRQNLGGALAIGRLERACISITSKRARVFRLPPRGKDAAVLGDGPSSLVAAFDLSKKGYAVTLFGSSAPGGWLRDLPAALLPPEILGQELALLAEMGVRFASPANLTKDLLTRIRTGCQSVYLGRDGGLAVDLFEVTAGADSETMALPEEGLFTGGIPEAGQAFRYITSIAEGRAAALSMDRFMQAVSLTAARPQPRRGRTDLFTSLEDIDPLVRILPQSQSGDYSPDEAGREAERCLDCQCLECVKHCAYLKEFGSYPKVYTRRVYNNEAIVKGTHQTNTFINSCSLCGQCEVLCPRDFSMASLCLEARQRMVDENRMPPSAHSFALDEMRSALGPQSLLIRHAPGLSSSRTILFPGCQLAAIRPEQTLALYNYLSVTQPATGIWLGCCGAPAQWAGRRTEYREIGRQILSSWHEMGKPRVLACCSSCLLMFRQHLPEIEVESVWTALAASWKSTDFPTKQPPLALTDPCTARNDAITQAAVRSLAAGLDQDLVELPMSGELTECCGYGGLMASANPELARKVIEHRVSQTSAGFLTYCIMCREQLAKTARPVLHILDLLFPETAKAAGEPPLGISGRRENRRLLKQKLLKDSYSEMAASPEPWQAICLKIAPDLHPILEKRRILEDDICQVLWLTGQSGHFFEHGTHGTRRASGRLGEVTFWLEYRLDGEEYLLENAWSHRMSPTGVAK